MQEFDYFGIETENLDGLSEFKVSDNGYYLFVTKKGNNSIEVEVNDEMVDEFSQETIGLLSRHFPIQNPVIVDTWAKEGVSDPPFHDNVLTFEVDKSVAIKDLIKFVFEKIYDVYPGLHP